MGKVSEWCTGTLATVNSNHNIDGTQTAESSTQCLSDQGVTEFQAHIIRQIINQELVEVVIYLDGKAISNVESSSGKGDGLGLAMATLAASYLVE